MASAYLTKTFGSAGNRKTMTFSFWIKKAVADMIISGVGVHTVSQMSQFVFQSNGTFYIHDYNSAGTLQYEVTSTAVYRDVSAWYHVVLAIDTTQATNTDRIKFYINGVQQSLSGTYPALNYDCAFNNNVEHAIGNRVSQSAYLDGSLAHFHFIDGTAYDASTFGETDATTGIWKPKTQPSVTYGTNGYFLKFENSGSMGTDSSGNANNFTVNGTLTQTVDTPSNVFAIMNPLATSSTLTFANGNLNVTSGGGDVWRATIGTLGFQKGKWYWEAKILTSIGGNRGYQIGVAPASVYLNPTNPQDENEHTAYYSEAGGEVVQQGTFTNSDFGSLDNGDILGIAVDYDSNQITFYKNGTAVASDYTIHSSLSGDWIPYLVFNSGSIAFNFGNGYFGTTAVSSATSDESGLGIFEHTVPSGYNCLCTKNINTYG